MNSKRSAMRGRAESATDGRTKSVSDGVRDEADFQKSPRCFREVFLFVSLSSRYAGRRHPLVWNDSLE